MRVILIAVLSIVFWAILRGIQKTKKLPERPIRHLIIYGMILAVPFITLEFLVDQIHPLMLIPVVLLEFLALFCERHIRFLEKDIEKNIAHLGLLSYLFIGLGFSYIEMVYFTIEAHSIFEVIAFTPFRVIFAASVHTTLFLSVGVAALGHKIWQLFKYYSEITYIGVSHFLYLLFLHEHMAYLVVPFMVINLMMMRSNLHLFHEYHRDLQAEFVTQKRTLS